MIIKVKFSSYKATKAYSGNRVVAPVIPYSGARRRLEFNMTFRQFYFWECDPVPTE
jgi:hypothetical protein